MKIIEEESWQSASLPPTRQLPGFQEVLDRTHFHWDLKSDLNDRYIAEVRRRAVNDYMLTHIVADPVTGFRSMDDVKKSNDAYFCLLFFTQGECLLEQGANETVVTNGKIAIWDSTRPAKFQNTSRLTQYSILIPRDNAKIMIPGIEDMCGLSVDGTKGLGSILHSHLVQIHQAIELVEPEDRPAVLRATVELVAAAFKPESANRSSTAFRQAVLNRVQEYIVANLGEPDLSPATVAAAFKFSPRYLHRLFEESDESAGSWIRKRRLHAAKADLGDAGNSRLSVTQIAMRRGFADASHFSHAFRKEFGQSPRQFKQSCRSSDPRA
ncbi:helix-turn-helix domain-containing protein [Sphingorhabdus sp. YGSMI21]|uniref:helix-turn-helix domain-containing protein n=1 Tax=Sphingorhabdus sp. YGSMI21 TaxID=2077182 RepID=UPI000C1E5A8D|nr:helix-turn-helix domain-containing protein [Sphingorhabdus sp. YGSMI21]ATW04998.1 hypothetical protein CHN51_16765 [Sphingorhabdus sp. YGSMI21]